MSSSPQTQARVRRMTDADLEQVLAWRNHEEVRRYMYSRHEISWTEHTHWFERAARDRNRHLLILEVDSVPRGFINIHHCAPSGVADWGFYTAPDAPKGTGRQLGNAALDYAFNEAGLHKICGQALMHNGRSIKFHLRLGFQQEGLLRDQYFDGNQYHNVICFGLIASEWLSCN